MPTYNLSSVLLRHIDENNLTPMREWSTRNTLNSHPRYKNFKKLKDEIRNLLEMLSGGDIVPMLKSVLTSNELEQLTPQKFSKSLENLVTLS